MMDGLDSQPSRLEASLGATLEELVPGVSVAGVAGHHAVDVVSVRWHGSNAMTLTYRDAHGHTGQSVLRRDHESGLRVARPGRTRPFDGDAAAWRLAAEALRIRYAALFDPMLATIRAPGPTVHDVADAVHGSDRRRQMRVLCSRAACAATSGAAREAA